MESYGSGFRKQFSIILAGSEQKEYAKCPTT